MKKSTSILLLVLLLIGSAAHAQFKKPLQSSSKATSSEARYNIGLVGGLTSTYWLHFGGTKTPYHMPFNFGPTAGLSIERMINNNSSVSLEGLFAMRKDTLSYEVLNFPVAVNENKDYLRKYKADYQEVNVQLVYTHYFSQRNIRPYVFVGPRFTLPVSIPKEGTMVWNKQEILHYGTDSVSYIPVSTDTIAVTEMGQELKLPIYNYNESTGEVTYNYGYPIFQLGREYDFKVKAYEPYVNYDKIAAGKLHKDALRDSVITFGNELGEATLVVAENNVVDGHEIKRGDMVKLTPEQVQLDSLGVAHYKWRAGIPALTAPFTRNMNASMVIQGKTKLWSSEGLTGIITGVVPTGNNFITAGPSHVQMVLRDPPGDASYATWAVDSVTSDYTYTVRGVHNETELGIDIRSSIEVDYIAGTAFFGIMSYNTVIGENQVTWKYDVHKTWDNHTSVTYTNGTSTSSSSAKEYVGRDGDVFIGYSTNYIIGAADKVGLFKLDNGSWGIDMQETMSMDEQFNTHFEYSQFYIENTLFGNIKRTRNTMLKHINSMDEIEENPQVATYYTLLTEDDPRYGSSNGDQATMPASPMVLKVATVCTGVTRSSSRGRKLLPLMKRIKSKPSTTRNTKKATSRLRLV